MARPKKLLVVDCAALGWNLVSSRPPESGLAFRRAEAEFPAVTCSAQALFRTATSAREHGLVSNGLFFPNLRKVMFWEQSADLVAGERIWAGLRARGRTVGMMFWQQSLGERVDFLLSPRPIHKHEGGMIQDCYSRPHDLYERVCEKIGRGFNLMHYWGPMASRRSSEWIVAATSAVMASPEYAPDLLFTYLPHLDYDLQRRGPASRSAERALDRLYGMLRRLIGVAEANGYDFLIWGDYAIGAVDRPPVFPNRALREAGLFKTRTIRGMAYPDFFDSAAFAVVDHEFAHVYCRDEDAARAARDVLQGMGELKPGGNHPRAGRWLLLAEKGSWCAYPWWTDAREAPDFATHVDIHNKPGYDPCELFWGWPPPSVSLNTARVRGTHGRIGPAHDIAWASSLRFDFEPKSQLDLAKAVRDWCDRTA